MANLENTRRRNKSIYEDYTSLFFVDFLREEIIWDRLAERYYLTPKTVYKIVLELRKEAAASQLNLDLNTNAEK